MLQIKEFIKSKLAHTFIYVAQNKRYNFITIRKVEVYAKTPDKNLYYIETIIGCQKDIKAFTNSIVLRDFSKKVYVFDYKYLPITSEESDHYIKIHSLQILKNLNPNV